jgi:hypothetical protein
MFTSKKVNKLRFMEVANMMPKNPRRGGRGGGQGTPGFGNFQRPTRVGDFIRDSMTGGGIVYAMKLYTAYSDYIASIPYRAQDKKGAKRKGMNYSSFRLYLYWARSLGLIEYTNPDGSDPGSGPVQSEPSDVPGLAGRLYFKMVDGAENSTAWQDLYSSYKASRP